MANSFLIRKTKETFLIIFLFMSIPASIWSQNQEPEDNDLSRTFMPNFQMGYVLHGSDELSGGLMTQLSME
ncbi:MAG: hypothetical protein AAFR66_04810, partial [Bacteroidota bacterium]